MQIPHNIEIALTPREKIQKLLTDIGGGWYMKKSVRVLPPLKRTKLSKKAQERQYYVQKKMYESNSWCNDWKSYSNAMEEMFDQIPKNVEIALTPKKKSKTEDRNWRWMVFEKFC